MSERGKAFSVLTASTLAFTACFAVWVLYGVLITYLADQGIVSLTRVQTGWLLGAPILTGSLLRLPTGILTDRFGGRPVFTILMLVTAGAVFLASYASDFNSLLIAGLGFGVAGAGFAVGIAYTAVWFPPHRQGLAMGIFGAGNAGAAITPMVAPLLLNHFTRQGADLEQWRSLPRAYAAAMTVVAILFWLTTFPRKPDPTKKRTLGERLEPLRHARVWRFGLYYFLVFGCFVALAQWLIAYYVNVYFVSVVTAGLLSSIFTLPSGVIRALGGWLSDRFGARAVLYSVLGGSAIFCLLLTVPRMDIQSPGEGVMSTVVGIVTDVTPTAVTVKGQTYPVQSRATQGFDHEGVLVWPTTVFWQEPVVKPGDTVVKKQLLARGVTHIYFQANMWIFTGLVCIVGLLLGIGKAAVYKYIPEYFPHDVGTVGGIVGVIGGLGGFVGPILFGYLLDLTGLWTSCWMFLALLSAGCLAWLHVVVRRMINRRTADVAGHVEDAHAPVALTVQVRCPVHGTNALVKVVSAEPLTGCPANCSLLQGESAPGAACEGQCVVAVEPAPKAPNAATLVTANGAAR